MHSATKKQIKKNGFSFTPLVYIFPFCILKSVYMTSLNFVWFNPTCTQCIRPPHHKSYISDRTYMYINTDELTQLIYIQYALEPVTFSL